MFIRLTVNNPLDATNGQTLTSHCITHINKNLGQNTGRSIRHHLCRLLNEMIVASVREASMMNNPACGGKLIFNHPVAFASHIMLVNC
jgi:hypothetical protein